MNKVEKYLVSTLVTAAILTVIAGMVALLVKYPLVFTGSIALILLIFLIHVIKITLFGYEKGI